MNRGAVANIFLGMLVALLPFYLRFSAYNQADVVCKEIFLMHVMILFVAFAGDKVRSAPKWIYCALAFFFICGTWNQDYRSQGMVYFNDPVAMSTAMHLTWTILSTAFVVRLYETLDTRSLDYILNGMALGCIAQSSICILDQFGIHYRHLITFLFDIPFVEIDEHRASIGSLGNQGYVGAYVALTSFSLLRNKWAYFWPLALIGVLCTLKSGAEMPLVAFLGGHLYYVWRRLNFPFWAPFAIVIAAFASLYTIGMVEEFNPERVDLWESSLYRFDPKLATFGAGPGAFRESFHLFHTATDKTKHFVEHNEFLSMFFAFGGVGLLIGIFAHLRATLSEQIIFASILFAAFCNFFCHFTMHQSTTAIIVLVSLGVCLVTHQRCEE